MFTSQSRPPLDYNQKSHLRSDGGQQENADDWSNHGFSQLSVLFNDVHSLPRIPASTDGWMPAAPRDEIKPLFGYEPNAGRGGQAALVIVGDERDGTTGWWQKKFAVEGGKTYRFVCLAKDRWRRFPTPLGSGPCFVA